MRHLGEKNSSIKSLKLTKTGAINFHSYDYIENTMLGSKTTTWGENQFEIRESKT